jgi:Mn2+/Fe2+ NRAMP family transporter
MGYFLIVLFSIVSVIGSAYGCKVLTNLSFITSLIVTGILCMTKMYFLRNQPYIEQAINAGWDRYVGYVLTTFLSIALAALGLYCYILELEASSTPGICSFGNFLEDTLKQDTTALWCWLASLIIEVLILILALFNRRRYYPYHTMD